MIRNVVLGLVVANLLYFGWSVFVGDSVPRLVAVAPQARAAPLPPPPRPVCTSLGPFLDEEAARSAKSSLEALGWEPAVREVKEQVPDGYWVTVENLPSETAQRRVVTAIRAAGISDAFAMPEDPGFRVSVGVFRDRARAEGRAALVRRLSIEAGVRDRSREATATWFDLTGVGSGALQDGRLAAAGLDPGSLTIQPCP